MDKQPFDIRRINKEVGMPELLEGSVPYLEEMDKAASRITSTFALHGGTEPAAVAWLLNFISRDVFSLKDWEREEALWNVIRFAADGGQRGADYGQSGGLTFRTPETSEQKTEALRDIQQNVVDAVDKYLKVGVASFPEDQSGFTIARGYPSLLFSGRSLRAAFFYMAAQLLARYGHRIKRCEGCPSIMLTGRKDQRFHSKICQIGTFVRKKRAEAKSQAKGKKKKVILNKGRIRHGKKR
jgi:hypothetical protein